MMSKRDTSPGMDYAPVGTDLKERFDTKFETEDLDHRSAIETAPTCTASCCTGAFSECSL